MAKNYEVNKQVAQARQGSTFFFREAVTFPSRSELGFCARWQPAGAIYSSNAPVVMPNEQIEPFALLALLNATDIRRLVDKQAHRRSYSPGLIRRLPAVDVGEEEMRALAEAGRAAVRGKWGAYSLDETTPIFDGFAIAGDASVSLEEVLDRFRRAESRALADSSESLEVIDRIVGAKIRPSGPGRLSQREIGFGWPCRRRRTKCWPGS